MAVNSGVMTQAEMKLRKGCKAKIKYTIDGGDAGDRKEGKELLQASFVSLRFGTFT